MQAVPRYSASPKSRPESCRLAAAALRRATATLPEAPDHQPKAREFREEDGYLTAFPPGRGTRRLIERRGALAAKPRFVRGAVLDLRFHHASPSTTAQNRSGSATPFSACSPRSSNRTPADVRASPRTMSETSTSPAAERPLMREAMFTDPP